MQGMKIWHLEKDPGEVLRSGRIDKQLNTVIFSPDMRQILTGGQAWDVNKKNKKYNSKPSSLRIFWNILNMLTIVDTVLKFVWTPRCDPYFKLYAPWQSYAGGTRIDLWNTLAEIKYTLGDWIDSDLIVKSLLGVSKCTSLKNAIAMVCGGAPGMVINLSKLSFNIQHWHALALYPLPAVANLLWRWKHFDILRCSFCRSWGKIVTPDMTC